MPDWWAQPNTENIKTQKGIMEQRRKEFLPDPTFDLDGDGIVGGRDLVLAKRFDKDKDGRLNTGERKEA